MANSRPCDPPRDRLIAIMQSFPHGEAVPIAGLHLSLEVCGKRLGWFMENHHGDERISINCKARPGINLAMVQQNPTVYHIPAFVRRWELGIWLDVVGIDWDEIEALLYEAYLIKLPKKLLRSLGESKVPPPK